MFNSEPRNIGSMLGITPAVKFLLILNIGLYIFDAVISMGASERILQGWFTLRANWWETFEFGQLFTYMFIHAGTTHLLANMMGLFFLGPSVERTIGSYKFFILYYVSGILGGLGWSMIADPVLVQDIYGNVQKLYPMCAGASGAVMGILGAFAALYPHAKLLLWFVIPVRAWVLVLILTLFELWETIHSDHPLIAGIANAAHLIGGVAGFTYAFSLKHPHMLNDLKTKLPDLGRKKPKSRTKSSAQPSLSKAEVDAILDKIGKQGMGALTPRERELLKRATRG
ncbi:rhomboid family intramembrane serine protease [Verrucomicrobia bacterium S94]|nr:rhomboid family intramembrane serine protease [Verrucomicrobia bacterium S94]